MSMPSWKRFERLVAAIHHAESAGAVVTWNDVLEGRQFDVTVRFKYGLHEYLTVIECKDESSKVSVEKVDAFVTKAQDVNANQAVMVSASGYQSGCEKVATRHGIRLLTLMEVTSLRFDDLVKEVRPMLNVYQVRFERPGTADYELEDIGGKLAYLMTHTKIRLSDMELTPDKVIDEISGRHVVIDSPRREFRATFPALAVVDVPHEPAFEATAIKFIAETINAVVPNRPVFDNHIMESMATAVELRGFDGKLEHKADLKDLDLGFDSHIEVGGFYNIPQLHINYYCDSISDGLVRWFLVESYQHGMLFQAVMQQKLKNCKGYVRITDQATISRLNSLLSRMKLSGQT